MEELANTKQPSMYNTSIGQSYGRTQKQPLGLREYERRQRYTQQHSHATSACEVRYINHLRRLEALATSFIGPFIEIVRRDLLEQ